MFKNKYQIIISILIFTSFVYSSPMPIWSEVVIHNSKIVNRGSEFTKMAYKFFQTGEYKKFVTHTAVAGKTAFLDGGVMTINSRNYFTPEIIPSNVTEIDKYDIVKVYSLFNVVYYVEKIDQDIQSILADISTPEAMQTVQATILACVYNAELIQHEKFSMFIYGNTELTENFKFYIGQPIGSSVLEEVNEGEKLPETPPNVMIISKESDNFEELMQYCKENKILTITDKPYLLKKGITIGIGTYSNDLKLILNTKAVGGSAENWKSDNIFYKKI